ncbi:hypothetical protein [Pseudomonas segetis]|uniref:hypothetical protein n=1 Tax=Pseudomonas segetis TaxID=298908 RepID=UPI001594FAF8|nr:hypothetical protein [Pseudomonas segetis]
MGLMLLGGSSDPARATQVVAWVPSDQAGSPEEASALAQQKVEEARRKSFSGGLSKLGMQTGRYPDGHSRSYATPADIFAERPIPFADTPAASPSFLASPRSYGPIFIRHNQFTLDAYKNDMTTSEAMLQASKYLPEWIYIYHHWSVTEEGFDPSGHLQPRPSTLLRRKIILLVFRRCLSQVCDDFLGMPIQIQAYFAFFRLIA